MGLLYYCYERAMYLGHVQEVGMKRYRVYGIVDCVDWTYVLGF
jgi:hypothetical protein